MSTTIDSLELEVKSGANSATAGIDALSASLSKLKGAIKGGVGLTSVTNQLRNLNSALSSVDNSNIDKIDRLATSLSKLGSMGNIKLSSSIGNQIKNIGTAASSLATTDFSGIGKLSTALQPLQSLSRSTGLQSAITQLNKLPQLAQTLNTINWSTLTSQLQQLANALTPLASQLNAVSTAFSRLPSQIRQTVTATNSLPNANNRAATSYVNLWAKARMAMNVLKGAVRTIASWITESNSYIESLNLFTASLGEYASEAQEYAERVSDILGIDPAEWLRNQGTFNTIIHGFGVASDQAYKMSKNLTQLGYDISSFFNISFEDAMQKLQSGISGELEPLRRLGYDLSVARLQQEAYRLGIDRSVNSMTQAEKAQLRYYAIMTQVTVAHGDMARTLNAPANQLRVLQAQVTQCARALGNIFIPALNAVLPYAIALAKVIRMLANEIASFFGFELPEVDYSGISSGASAVGDLSDNLGDASNNAKKLKNGMLGIDELNILQENDASNSAKNGGLGAGGSDLGIDLPEYDFLGDAISSKVDEIMEKLKPYIEWIKDHFQQIATLVAIIGAALLAWKLAKSLLDNLLWMKTLANSGLSIPLQIAAGVILTVTGIAIEWAGIMDIIKNGIDKFNFGEVIGGALLTVAGSSILGKGIANFILTAFGDSAVAAAITEAGGASVGALFGAALGAIVAGVPMFFVGVWSAIKEGLNWLNGILITGGATLTGAGIGAMIGALGGPIGAGVGALIGLVVGLLTDFGIWLYQNWDSVVDTCSKAWSKIEKWWKGTVVPALKALPNKVATAFKNLPKTLQNAFNGVLTWLGGLPEKIKSSFHNMATKIDDWFDKLWKPIKDYNWNNLGHDLGVKLGNAVKGAITLVTKTIPTKIAELTTKIGSALKTFFTETLPKFFTEWLPDVVTQVANFFLELPEKLDAVIKSVREGIIEVGSSIVDGLVEGLKTIGQAIKDFVKGFIDGVKEALGIHSPSTVFKEIGKFCIDGLFQGLLDAVAKIKQWAIDHIITPVQNAINNNPLKAGVQLIKQGWTTLKNWIGNIPTLSQAINLIKSGWTTIKNWIGNIPTLSQAISLLKSGWTTVKNWIGNIPTLSQLIGLAKSGWTSVKNWIGNLPTISQAISLAKSGWTSISSFVGTSVTTYISLAKRGWTSISSFIGTSVSVGVSLVKSGWSSFKKFFGLSTGGYFDGHGMKMFDYAANGGFFNSHGRGYWGNIPMYANGTTNAGLHGSMFVAGENGAEMVGHINGQTEVLNRSQISMAMKSAVISGMSQFTGYWRAMYSQMAVSANGIIRSVLVSSDTLQAAYATGVAYEPTAGLSQSVYEDSARACSRHSDDATMARTISEFYRDYVEPTLLGIASDTKRQADKEEQTIVNIGNRTITDAVETQRKANGYRFTK